MAVTWNFADLSTMGDVGDMVLRIIHDGIREDAQRFMAEYEIVTPRARENIGYWAGYYDAETAHQIWDWFDCVHPVFGTRIPTAEEAFRAGVEWASATNDDD